MLAIFLIGMRKHLTEAAKEQGLICLAAAVCHVGRVWCSHLVCGGAACCFHFLRLGESRSRAFGLKVGLG